MLELNRWICGARFASIMTSMGENVAWLCEDENKDRQGQTDYCRHSPCVLLLLCLEVVSCLLVGLACRPDVYGSSAMISLFSSCFWLDSVERAYRDSAYCRGCVKVCMYIYVCICVYAAMLSVTASHVCLLVYMCVCRCVCIRSIHVYVCVLFYLLVVTLLDRSTVYVG
jgi:hypothetical protein